MVKKISRSVLEISSEFLKLLKAIFYILPMHQVTVYKVKEADPSDKPTKNQLCSFQIYRMFFPNTEGSCFQ